jgi:hypothetical protein
MLRKIMVCMFLISAVPVFADTQNAQEENKEGSANNNYIGLSASYLSGAGLSYMREWTDGFRTKFTGLYYLHKFTQDHHKSETIYKNGGGELQVDIFSSQFARRKNSEIRIYLLAGGAYWHMKYHRYKELEDRYRDKYNKYYSAGGGIGAGLILSGRLGIDVSGTYQVRNSTVNDDRYVGPACGVSIFFIF